MGRLWAKGRPLQYFVTAICLSAFILFGYDQGVFGGILNDTDWNNQFHTPGSTLQGVIVSAYDLGCLVGCGVNLLVGEWLGRRRAVWFAMGWVIIGAALQCSAFTVAHLIVGRIVTGIGTGVMTSTVPVYQSELCDRKLRGRLISAEVLFVGIGITLAYWLDFGLSYAPGPIGWRFPLAFQILFAIFVIIIVFGVPESPRWLCRHGRRAEAVDVLCAVRDADSDDPYIMSELEAIDHALEIEEKEEKSQSFLDLFKKDELRTRNRIGLAWTAQFMNQVGGINLVVYYSPLLLVKNIGMPAKTAQIIGGCINMMFPLGSLFPTFTLDRMGRRRTMMWGSLGLGISMMLVAAMLSQAGTTPDGQLYGQSYASASVTFFFTYMIIFGGTVNCVPWVYVPEILPLKARTKGTAIGVSSNWLWNFVIVMITPTIIDNLAWKGYLIFMCTNLSFIPLVYFFFPETSNIGLEDVDHIFTGGGNPVSKARAIQKEMRAGNLESGRAGVVRTNSLHDVDEKQKQQLGAVHQERVSQEQRR